MSTSKLRNLRKNILKKLIVENITILLKFHSSIQSFGCKYRFLRIAFVYCMVNFYPNPSF